MSGKIPLKNGINCDAQWKNNMTDTSVKLAGEEAKDRLYETKHKRKAGRVLTVIAYVFFVSLAAIMLSLYYVFLWNGDPKTVPNNAMMQRLHDHKCSDIVADMQQELDRMTTTQQPETTTWMESYSPVEEKQFRADQYFPRKLFQLDQRQA